MLSNTNIAVRYVATPLREFTCHMGSHITEVTFTTFTPAKLVLDLATPGGCKAMMFCYCCSVCLFSVNWIRLLHIKLCGIIKVILSINTFCYIVCPQCNVVH